MGCMAFLESALTIDGTLSQKEAKKRRLFFWVAVISAVFSMFSVLGTGLFSKVLDTAAMMLLLSTYVVTVVWILCKQPMKPTYMVGVLYLQSAIILVWDLNARVILRFSWPLMVLCVDLLLVLEVPARYTVGLVCFTIGWLVVLALEETFRFGIFDMPLLLEQWGREEYFRERTQCGEKLPCKAPFPFGALAIGLAVFVLDFIATRGFAHAVLKEQAAMERTISVVQEIASLLAKYDVEGVSRMLETQRDQLPEEMHATLHRMEENLRRYRPYLPAALFDEEEAVPQEPNINVAPPGVDHDVATIVFTDIRLSTSIWECAPEGMRAGLRTHNAVIRSVMQAFNGYEVKTIGDAFMVAFEKTVDGVNFGLRVHEALRSADWPASLLENAPICADQGPLWGGLTVRIGVNSGPVDVEHCLLTGRTDYFGHTVNVAARLESVCTPGAVAICCDLWEASCSDLSAVSCKAQLVDLKGVSDSVRITSLWPVSLAGRRNVHLRDAAGTRQLADNASEFNESGFSSRASASTHASNSMSPLQHVSAVSQVSATIGVVDVSVGDEYDADALRIMSAGLSTLTVALDQSGGVLVTLLGSRVCVGWNLTRATLAHMENAVRFVQRMKRTALLLGAGFSSGVVQHGDVGARTQRFVTVMGPTVRACWVLCDEAVRAGCCLYEPQEGLLPPAVESMVSPFQVRDGVYTINEICRESIY